MTSWAHRLGACDEDLRIIVVVNDDVRAWKVGLCGDKRRP